MRKQFRPVKKWLQHFESVKFLPRVSLSKRSPYLPSIKELLCLELTGTPDIIADVITDVFTDFEMASVGRLTARLVDSLVAEVVDHVIFSVGACVVVEFVERRAAELAVVEETVDCIVGAVVVAFVVVSFWLQRGSLKENCKATVIKGISKTLLVY